MKVSAITTLFTVAALGWSPLGLADGRPVENENVLDNVKAVTGLYDAPRIKGKLSWRYVCPGELSTSRPFEVFVDIVNNSFKFSPATNIDELFRPTSQITLTTLDGFVGFRDSVCVPANVIGSQRACTYRYQGWLSTHIVVLSKTIKMKQYAQTPKDYPAYVVQRTCQSSVGRPRGWCPQPDRTTVTCTNQGFIASPL